MKIFVVILNILIQMMLSQSFAVWDWMQYDSPEEEVSLAMHEENHEASEDCCHHMERHSDNDNHCPSDCDHVCGCVCTAVVSVNSSLLETETSATSWNRHTIFPPQNLLMLKGFSSIWEPPKIA